MSKSIADVSDSKVLSHDVRQRLWESFTIEAPLCYSSATLSPQGISAGMLRRVPINLNRQAEVSHLGASSADVQEATIGLIKSALDRGINIKEVRSPFHSDQIEDTRLTDSATSTLWVLHHNGKLAYRSYSPA